MGRIVTGDYAGVPAYAYRGIVAKGAPPDCLESSESFDNQLAVVGCARGVWDDIAQIPADSHILAVNHIGLYLPRIDHWASLHADMVLHFYAARLLQEPDGWGCDTRIHGRSRVAGHYENPRLAVWEFVDDHARTSGCFATLVALMLGYERITLYGIPMDGSGNFHGPWDGSVWQHDHQAERAQWERWAHHPAFEKHVRSVSGWTRGLLGHAH